MTIKQSLREEFDQLKNEFERLSDDGKVTAEVRALFRAMIVLFELLIAVFMEKQAKKNNNNSSILFRSSAWTQNTDRLKPQPPKVEASPTGT